MISFMCQICNKLIKTEENETMITDCPHCKNSVEIPYKKEGVANQLDNKNCQFCGETILKIAKKCKHCGEYFDQSLKKQNTNISITEKDPFAEYHTNIKGKKEGKITILGWFGILFGICIIIMSFCSMQTGKEENILIPLLFGFGFIVASYMWARKV